MKTIVGNRLAFKNKKTKGLIYKKEITKRNITDMNQQQHCMSGFLLWTGT